jgi:hypothetical protein
MDKIRFNDSTEYYFGGIETTDDTFFFNPIEIRSIDNENVLDVGVYQVYSLEDYLPADNYNYEIMCDISMETSNELNSSSNIWLYNGNSPDNYYYKIFLSWAVTKVAKAPLMPTRSCILPIDKNMRCIMLYNRDLNIEGLSQGAPKNWDLYIRGYKRLGTNE